jgi:hypothetical protein
MRRHVVSITQLVAPRNLEARPRGMPEGDLPLPVRHGAIVPTS